MVRNASLFSQLLQHLSRTEFAALVKQHRAERGSKGFTCWTQCVAMLFCHLARADSLREICNGLACCLGKLSHLGIERAPKKSTLSYANQHRPASLYESLFWSLLARFRARQQTDLPKRRTPASRTGSCLWIPPSSPCVLSCFPGRNTAAPRVG